MRHNPRDISVHRDVGLDCLTNTAFCADDGSGLLRRWQAQVYREHPCAFSRISHGRGLAVAPTGPNGARAQHQCDLVFEPLGHARVSF